jgi:hypothetical protein
MHVNLILVKESEQIRQSLTAFNAEPENFLDLARSLLRNTTYWVYDDTQRFGPAKFVGFVGMSFANYQKARNHWNTGHPFNGNRTRRAIESALGAGFASDENLPTKLQEWGESILGPGVFDGVNKSKWKFVQLHFPLA